MTDEVKPSNVPAPIVVDEKSQQLVARDQSELIRIIEKLREGNAFPKTLDTNAKAIAAWQVLASLGLPPAAALRNVAVIQGTVAIWGDLPKALAERTGQLEVFRQVYVDKNSDEICLKNRNLSAEAWACVVQIKRKGRDLNEYFFSLDDAQKAGLLNKSGPWKDYRRTMLARRTIGMAIKFEFPDALMGVPVAEYDLHEAPDLKDVTPLKSHGEMNSEAVEEFQAMLRQPEMREAMNEQREGRTDDPAPGREGVSRPGGSQDRAVQADLE